MTSARRNSPLAPNIAGVPFLSLDFSRVGNFLHLMADTDMKVGCQTCKAQFIQ
jgi:hypothetical protein